MRNREEWERIRRANNLVETVTDWLAWGLAYLVAGGAVVVSFSMIFASKSMGETFLRLFFTNFLASMFVFNSRILHFIFRIVIYILFRTVFFLIKTRRRI